MLQCRRERGQALVPLLMVKMRKRLSYRIFALETILSLSLPVACSLPNETKKLPSKYHRKEQGTAHDDEQSFSSTAPVIWRNMQPALYEIHDRVSSVAVNYCSG
jgi:hypothetical protein